MSEKTYIGIIGAGICDSSTAELAFEVGAMIAERGAVLVCGGLGGVMEAACRGAQSMGGVTIGILPGEKCNEGNPYLSFTVATGIGHARNLAITATSDILIAIGGEYGTLSEIGLAKKLGKKVIGLGSWRVENSAGTKHIIQAKSPAEAVELTLRAIKTLMR